MTSQPANRVDQSTLRCPLFNKRLVSYSTAVYYPARSRDDTLQYFHGSTFKDTAAHTLAITHTTEISDINERFPPARTADAKAYERGFYLFTGSAGIAVIWVDSCPWRHREQHFYSSSSSSALCPERLVQPKQSADVTGDIQPGVCGRD